MKNIFPTILAKLTGKERYRPDIHWSKDSWVHNIFRLYELIFWRRLGIRCENSTNIRKENGMWVVSYRFFSIEAILAHAEVLTRNFLKKEFRDKLRRIHVEVKAFQFALPYGQDTPLIPWISFAIAFDAADGQYAGTSPSFGGLHTCTGSNLALVAGVYGDTADDVTGVTYNSVALTFGSKAKSVNSFWVYTYILAAPTVGSHTITVSKTSGNGKVSVTSYTGAKQTAQPDATGTLAGETASGDRTASITTVTDNCWLACTHTNEVVAAASVVNGTERTTLTNDGDLADSNAAIGVAGIYTIGYHWNASDRHAIAALAIAPVGATTTSTTITTSTTTTSSSTSSSTTTTSSSTSSSTTTTSSSSSSSTTISTSSTLSTTTTLTPISGRGLTRTKKFNFSKITRGRVKK